MAKKTKVVAAPINDEEALFNELVGASQEVKANERPKKEETIPLTDAEGIGLLETWAASTVASKVLTEQAKGDAAAFKEFALDAFCKLWEELGGKPANPTFSTGMASGCLQVKAPITICIPKDSTVKQQLVQAGLPAKSADAFQGLVSTKTELSIKGLHKLREGTPEEREAVQALMVAIQLHLTQEQRKLVLESERYDSVEPEKLFNTISTTCKNANQIRTVLRVLSPQPALSNAKHTEALAVTQKRLGEAKEAFDKAQAEKESGRKSKK